MPNSDKTESHSQGGNTRDAYLSDANHGTTVYCIKSALGMHDCIKQ